MFQLLLFMFLLILLLKIQLMDFTVPQFKCFKMQEHLHFHSIVILRNIAYFFKDKKIEL